MIGQFGCRQMGVGQGQCGCNQIGVGHSVWV